MKICLIGSTKFMDLYREVNRRLTLSGHVVYTVATVSSSTKDPIQGEEITEDEKVTLDLVHFRKIQESEAVVIVTDETGYIGFSTKREIKWTLMHDLPIYQMSELNHLCDLEGEYRDVLESTTP